MINLNSTGNTVVMLIVAAVVGAVAGLGGYSLQSRSAADQDTRLGVVASMLVGGLASLGVLYFFSPVTNTTATSAAGAVTSASRYDLVKLVALAVIVGSAGRAFLTALQSRTAALLSQQTSTNVLTQVPRAFDNAKTKLAEDTASVNETIGEHVQRLTMLAAQPGAPDTVKEAAEALTAAQGELTNAAGQAQAHLEEAQGRIEAAASPAIGQTQPPQPPTAAADGPPVV